MAYEVRWSPHAGRAFDKLPFGAQRAIAAKVRWLATDPRPPGSRKLKGSHGTYRVRAGEYRILYEVTDAVLLVWVVDVGPRKSVYKDR